MNYRKDKEYNLKYATNNGETKEVKIKPEKDMTTPEMIMKLKNDNKDFFKLLENKRIKSDDLKIGDIYIDRSHNLQKVLDRPLPEKDLGIIRKQLTKVFMPGKQNLKGTEWKLQKIRRATDNDFENYPLIESLENINEEKFKKKLVQAMEILGYYYDDIDSYDSWIVFNSLYPTGRITFGSWKELEEWLNGVVIDDPEEAKAVDDILDKWYKLPTEDKFEDEILDESKERLVEDMEDTIGSETGFYIGDPCYVLPDEIYDEIWGEQYNFEDGKIIVKNGLAFLVHGTAYGDGEYFDNIGTSYGVDSGTLAVVPFELIKKPETMPSEGDYEYGRFVAGTNATLEYVDGVFTFKVNGKEIVIDTDPVYDDYEYEDDDYENNEEDDELEDDD